VFFQGAPNAGRYHRGMPNHISLRTLAASRTVSRLALGIAAAALTLPLAACDTGVDPRDPNSPPASEASESASASGDAAVDPVGRWTSPEAGDPYLEFLDDGSLEGSDGCNVIATTWEVEDDEIVIDSFMTTQKACSGVDPWLSKAATATIEGNVMKVEDSNGKVIGGLEKEDT
jgi:heat shock protein HslJ